MLIYNLSPAPSPPGQPYKNWADGRCPFARDVWENSRLSRASPSTRTIREAARAIGHALGWDQGESPIDLKSDLFASYSLMERRRRCQFALMMPQSNFLNSEPHRADNLQLVNSGSVVRIVAVPTPLA